MMISHESDEFSNLGLLGHDVGGYASHDIVGRRGKLKVVEGKVPDGVYHA